MDFKSTKGPLKTTTLIGWMWKRGDTWSWPVLITRAAWPYNTQEVLMVDIKLDENKTLVFNANWLLSDKLNGKQFCLVTIASGNHLNPSRTQKWKRFAPMIVWEFPCESRSTPGIYSKQKGLSRKTGPFFVLQSKYGIDLRTHGRQSLPCDKNIGNIFEQTSGWPRRGEPQDGVNKVGRSTTL